MMDNIILNKAEIIDRCLKRIRDEFDENPKNLRDNITKQDSILLNLERACQAAIDMAMHVIRLKRLGIPKDTRDAFAILCDNRIIPPQLKDRMFGMVGFRNTAVHNYKALDLDIIEAIIKSHLNDFKEFAKVCLKL